MLRCFKKNWLLGLAALAVSPVSAQESPWQQPEHLRGSNVRIFQSDGTAPAASKGPKPKAFVATPTPIASNVEKPKREAELAPAVLPVVHMSPIGKVTSQALPRLPHGHQDPTHPVGPAEPGSGVRPRLEPPVKVISSGYALPRR